MKKVSFLLCTAFLLAGLAHAQGLHSGITLPTTSMAVTDNVFSTLSNPAWLGSRSGAELLFGIPYNDSSSSDNSILMVKLGSLGFAGEFDNNGPFPYNRYTLASGSKLGAGFYFGISRSWYKAVDWDGSWNLGLGYRPLPFLSAGATVFDLNQPEVNGVSLEPTYGLSLALRPFDERLTVSGDLFFTKDEFHDYGDDLDPIIRLEALPLAGVRLLGEYRVDSQYLGFGLALHLDNLSLGNYRIQNDDNEHAGSIGYMHLTSDRFNSILTPDKKKYVEIVLDEPILETMPQYLIFRPEGRTLHQLRQQIIHYSDDPDVDGLIIRFEGAEMGLAQAQQIRRTLDEFKLSGKHLIAYAEDYSQLEYYIASVCDDVYLMHIGGVDLRGLGVVLGYWKGALDKLGIGVQVVKVADHKTAANSFIYEGTTEAEAEMMNWLLDDVYDQMCGNIAFSRGWEIDDLKTKIDAGPYFSTRALKAELVDDLVYYDEITDGLKDDGFAIQSEKKYWRMDEYDEEWPDVRIPKVALIYAEGAIVQGESSSGFFSGDVMGAATIAEAIKTAREDKSIDAIILRVNSPGGSAFASEVIYREVRRTVIDDKNRKPIIVSMGNVAGSGGYYIACAADTIIAEEGTITGSIGVLGGKINLQGLNQKIHHNTETIKRGEHADAWRMHRPFTEEEMGILQDAVEAIYDDFITRVAESRPLTKEQVNEVGEGRVWTGKQAVDNQLVDLLGGIDLAFEVTRSMIGVEPGSTMKLSIFPKHKNFFQTAQNELVQIASPGLPAEIVEALQPLSLMMELYDGEPLMLMPYSIDAE
ncbi:signal peptide peptidase SppA [bacterium]|nr:signal peptide peptidase SppA [bacterium]